MTHPSALQLAGPGLSFGLPAGRPAGATPRRWPPRSTTGPSGRRNPQAQGVAAGSLGWASLAQGRLPSAINHFRESVAVLDEADWTAVRSLSLAGPDRVARPGGDADGAGGRAAAT